MLRPFWKDSRQGLQTSPWIILGATAILFVIVLTLAIDNTRREKRYISDILSAKGAALIRAVEAGARTGMMGWQLGGRHVQRLLEETAALSDLFYLALVNEEGTVVAHSDPEKIGSTFRQLPKLDHSGPAQKENWELVTLDDGRKVFEVHRYFQPLVSARGGRFGGHRGMMRFPLGSGLESSGDSEAWFTPENLKRTLIVVGMDVAPLQEAIDAEMRTTIILSLVLLLLGCSGLVSLFWMNHYRITKKSLRDTSAFADEVVTHLPVGVIATDTNGEVAFYNAAAENITGKMRAEVIGRPAAASMPVELCEFEKLLDNRGVIMEEEIECLFGPGRSVPLSISAARILNDIGDFVGNILILRDLGEVKRLQEEIRRQEKLAAVGGLAAGVAHEIRNPLSSIKGMATYLAGLFDEKSEPRQAANVMIQEVERLNRAITELLELTRPASLNRCDTEVEPLLKRSLQLIQPDAEAHEIAVELSVAPELCLAWIDPDRISQCLLNLYINAIQSMENGGLLTVKAAPDGEGRVRIEVIDTGGGIAPENLGRIFNPYFTTKPGGTGLGLAIVHKIITAHQGRLNVASTLEKGSIFTFWIPCKSHIQQEREP